MGLFLEQNIDSKVVISTVPNSVGNTAPCCAPPAVQTYHLW